MLSCHLPRLVSRIRPVTVTGPPHSVRKGALLLVHRLEAGLVHRLAAAHSDAATTLRVAAIRMAAAVAAAVCMHAGHMPCCRAVPARHQSTSPATCATTAFICPTEAWSSRSARSSPLLLWLPLDAVLVSVCDSNSDSLGGISWLD
jgi:hypothetical protein